MKGLLFMFSAFALISCNVVEWPETIGTSFEDFEWYNDSLWIEAGGTVLFSEARIDSIGHSGKYSLLSGTGGQNALTIAVDKPDPDGRYLLSVWCYSPGPGSAGTIEASVLTGTQYEVIASSSEISSREGDWVQIELWVETPPYPEPDKVQFSLLNGGDNPVWFDDFRLEFIERAYYPEWDADQTLNLNVSEPDLERLREQRLGAFKRGYLSASKDDRVRAEFEMSGMICSGELALKGDQLYNLQGDKWSLKFLPDNPLVCGTSSFSLHRPEIRGYLNEWVFRRLLLSQGIVVPSYDFVPVTLNGRSLGVYAIEDQLLDEQFVERDSVNMIGRYKDLLRLLPADQLDDPESSAFLQADIEVFESREVEKETERIFKNRIADIRNLSEASASFFDKDKLARFMAICDLTGAHYALHWSNIRFVYNLNSGLIEPVGNDGFSPDYSVADDDLPFIGYSETGMVYEPERWKAVFLHLLNDEEVFKHYLEALREVSSRPFIDAFKQSVFIDIRDMERMLRREYPSYSYDYSHMYQRARAIRNGLVLFHEHLGEHQPEYVFKAAEERQQP